MNPTLQPMVIDGEELNSSEPQDRACDVIPNGPAQGCRTIHDAR
jgi:hypothetical protein